MVHIRLRPKQNDDRWYQIDFVMQDESMAYYSNFDGRLPAEMVHVVPLSGGLPRQMFIAVEALDEVAYAHAIDAQLFEENDEMGLPQDQTSLLEFGLEVDTSTEPTDNDGESISSSRRCKTVLNLFLCLAQRAGLLAESKGHPIHDLIN